MGMLRILRTESKKPDWTDGLQWLSWNLICSLLPIWITLLGLKFLNQDLNMSVFTNNGEFALYSASFIGSCLYIVMHDFKKKNFPSRGTVCLLLFPLLLLAGCMFAFIALFNILKTASVIPPTVFFNREFIRHVSYWLLPAVLFISYLIVVSDNVRTVPSIKEFSEKRKQAFEAFSKNFDALEDN